MWVDKACFAFFTELKDEKWYKSINHIIQIYSEITSDRVLDGELSYT